MTTCPKCGHMRTPGEDATTPAWQCPACGVAYAKSAPREQVDITVSEEPKSFSLTWFIRPTLVAGVIGFVLFGGLYAYKEHDRRQQLEDAERVMALGERWSNAWMLASSTSRIALAVPVKDLQALAQEARDMKASGCADVMRLTLLDGMDTGVKSFLAFMQGTEHEEEAALLFGKTKLLISKYADDRDNCLIAIR